MGVNRGGNRLRYLLLVVLYRGELVVLVLGLVLFLARSCLDAVEGYPRVLGYGCLCAP